MIIIHQTTTSYSPQQNDIAECKNHTLKEMINVMLISSRAPHNLLGDAILTINYIINKVPYKKLEKIPYEFEKGRKSSYKFLKV